MFGGDYMTVFETWRCLFLSNCVCGGGKKRAVDQGDSQTCLVSCGSLASDMPSRYSIVLRLAVTDYHRLSGVNNTNLSIDFWTIVTYESVFNTLKLNLPSLLISVFDQILPTIRIKKPCTWVETILSRNLNQSSHVLWFPIQKVMKDNSELLLYAKHSCKHFTCAHS